MSHVRIPTVPATITRSQLEAMMSLVGLGGAWEDLIELHVGPAEITVVVLAKGEDGEPYMSTSGSHDLAKHTLMIRLDDTN